ncbi:MAG: hypothetical protein HY770_02795 [Chitinivibrionia bacterium]|nr:hypothetical protein [Chitinivibrionia bacterium]
MKRALGIHRPAGLSGCIGIVRPALLGLLILALPAAHAGAQVFYAHPGAPVVTDEQPVIGPYIAIGDDLFRASGFGRFNVMQNMDMGLELVFDLIDDNWFAGAGVDLKYSIVPPDYDMPFDLAANAGLGFTSGHDITTILAPFGAIISRPLELSSGYTLTPYGGVYLLIAHVSVDAGPLGDISDTDTDVELRAGLSLEISGALDVFSAAHLGSGNKVYFGLNFRL